MTNHASNRLTAFSLIFAILFSSSTLVLGAPGTRSISAEIIVSGSDSNEPSVLLNGERASSGRTFQSTGVITTTAKGTASVNIGKLGRIVVLPGSNLSLSFADNTISGELTSGEIRVLNNEGVAVNINTINNAKVAQTADDDDDDDDKPWIPILIFAGVVGTVVAIVVTRSSDNVTVVSPVR